MGKIAISVENLSKAYQLGQFGTGTISRDLERWWTMQVRKREDPFLKIGETNDRSTKGTSNIIWSLDQLSFQINQGESVGIIGKNGAGKSTLLKILSRVTSPTRGVVKIRGRVTSLLEVGTGFHPELTGRENIYLNGAILGMRKSEISKKLDEIIDFSGVERFIDTPVKRYSSGMYVRLAFAVAAHLESEILVVDEVLAVGDIEFQKKCLNKMGDISNGEGRTVLFVSHNLNAVRKITNKTILLNQGSVQYFGETNVALDQYLSTARSNSYSFDNSTSVKSYITRIELLDNKQKYDLNESISFKILYFCSLAAQKLSISLALYDSDQNYVLNSPSITTEKVWSQKPHRVGLFEAVVTIPGRLLNQGVYFANFMLVEDGRRVIDEVKDTITIELQDISNEHSYFGYWGGLVRPTLNWRINAIN